jgi:hypothetical protein
MICVFAGPKYLQAPNEEDMVRLMAMNEARGCARMLGSIDCMHWHWKNYRKAWHAKYCSVSHDPTIVLEAVNLYLIFSSIEKIG